MDKGYLFACTIDDLQEGIGKRLIINDVEIAIFKVNCEIFALNNICPHQQTRLIYEGFIENDFVVCPAHGWKFNLKTGKKSSGSNGLTSYPVEIIENQIFVNVQSHRYNW